MIASLRTTAVTSWGPNRLGIFALGTDDGIYHKAWIGTQWTDWEGLGGTFTSPPSAVAWGPDRLDIFALGTDNGIHHKAWIGTQWTDWELLGGIFTSPPS